MSEKAKVAVVYSAPLSTSAVANVKEDKHGEYVSYMQEHFKEMFNTGKLNGCGIFNARFMSTERGKLPNNVIPDLSYDSKHLVVRGDAKANLPDLASNHTVVQIIAYVEDMKENHPECRKVLMLSTPFCLQGIVYQILNSIKRIKGNDFFDGIDIELVCELTDKTLDAPSGWDRVVETYDCPRTNLVNLPNHGYTNVKETILPIDCFEFDGKNARLLGYDPYEVLSQEECYERLLADGDTRDKEKAVKRRVQLASGCINEPLIVKQQANGKYRVYEGNSRLAVSRDILRQTASAEGYRMLKATVFPEETPDGVLEAYKQYLQSQVRLEHGKIRDAADMYRKAESGMTYEEISETFGGAYSFELVENAVNTIRWMKELGMGDSMMDKLYNIAYHLRSSVKESIVKYWEKRNVELNEILMTFAMPGFDEEWYKYNNYRKFVKVLNTMQYAEWTEPAIKGFMKQESEWAKFRDWNNNYEKLEAEHKLDSGTKSVTNKVVNASKTLMGYADFLAEIKEALGKSTSKATDKKILKNYTQSQRGDLAVGISELAQSVMSVQALVLEVNALIDTHSAEFD